MFTRFFSMEIKVMPLNDSTSFIATFDIQQVFEPGAQ